MPDEIAGDAGLQAAFRKIIEIKLAQHYREAGFMSFGLVQLGQTAATLGEGELAYQVMARLVNSYWLSNLASMHNHRSLFNMDISGGMPAVILDMLGGSAPGKIKLLPALPVEWPTGSLDGALCRGAIEVRHLHWDGKKIQVSLISPKAQSISLQLPSAISKLSVIKGDADTAKADSAEARKLTLPAGVEVSLDILLE
jgi:hypothetical protein